MEAPLAARKSSAAPPDVRSGIHAVPPGTQSENQLSSQRQERTPPIDFEHAYTSHFHQVCRWLRAFGCPSSDIDDLAQETFLVVRRKLDTFDGRHLSAWIYRIAQRTASDHRRRAWFRRMFYRSSEEPDSFSGAGADPHTALEQRRSERILQRAMERMSPKRRAAFYLFEVEGYSGEEIAELEGVPLGTVYTRIHHARKDFVRLVGELIGPAEREEER
jgi:RNA polymerase sigma-70 factor (ECF subfamily)